MHPVIDELLDLVAEDSLPAAHTSSHWREDGREIVVERRAHELCLRPKSFETVSPMGRVWRSLSVVERYSYRPVTARFKRYPEVWQAATQLARDLTGGPHYNFNVFKSACALSVLADHWEAGGLHPMTFAMIGDGCGFLSALIRRWLPTAKLYCLDLPKTLVFQAQTLGQADPDATFAMLSSSHSSQGADAVFVPPQEVERITEDIDCAINIASMQEMTEFSINYYFTFLRRRSTPYSRFYCVNRLQKELRGGEVTQFERYPWRADDEIFLDGPCPYYTHYLAPWTDPAGPRVLGLRVPCVNSFLGVMRHRLVHLAPLL